jgi:hypothetical protein
MAWRCFTFAPSDTQTIYAGTGAFLSSGNFTDNYPAMGIFKTVNGGQTWTPATDSTSQYAQVAEIAVKQDNPPVVYAASTTTGILKTTNGGSDWSTRNVGLPADPRALSVAIDPADSTHLLAGLVNAGLYESLDSGSSWQTVSLGLPAEALVHAIVFSSVDPNVVFIGDRRSGVYRSTDGGASWYLINSGLRTRAVNALALSTDGETLYAGTEGEGVFRLDGAAVVSVDNPTLPGQGIGLRQSYPNPSGPSVTIEFTLRTPSRALVRIFDARGRLVRVLLDEPRGAGLHRLVWDGCDDAASGVASGVYIYRLQAGDLDQSRQMVLVR